MRRKIGKSILPPFYVGVGLFVIVGFLYLIITTIPTMLSELNIRQKAKAIIAITTMVFGWFALAIFLFTIFFKSKLRKA